MASQNKPMVGFVSMITGIIFDLDGTLIDTEPAAADAVGEVFSEWNIEIDSDDTHYVTGRTWESACQFLFKKYKIPLGFEDAMALILERYRQCLERNLPIVPGSVHAVENLSKRFPLGLVSGSNRNDILWALEKLNILQHFKVVLGAEDYPKSKPAPDGYLKAIEMLGVSPQSCLIFEDSTPGIASALAAGARVVAITSTNHFQQDTSQAHLSIPDLTTVSIDWVSKLWDGRF